MPKYLFGANVGDKFILAFEAGNIYLLELLKKSFGKLEVAKDAKTGIFV